MVIGGIGSTGLVAQGKVPASHCVCTNLLYMMVCISHHGATEAPSSPEEKTNYNIPQEIEDPTAAHG